jgi:hypothetical protein
VAEKRAVKCKHHCRYWLSAADSPLTLTVFNSQYLSRVQEVTLSAGATTTTNFVLKPAQSCG